MNNYIKYEDAKVGMKVKASNGEIYTIIKKDIKGLKRNCIQIDRPCGGGDYDATLGYQLWVCGTNDRGYLLDNFLTGNCLIAIDKIECKHCGIESFTLKCSYCGYQNKGDKE